MRNELPILAALILLTAAAGACGHGDDPAAAYRDYLSALAEGEVDDAFAMLAPASRERLAELEEIWSTGGSHPLVPEGIPRSRGREPGRELFGVLIGGGEVPDVAPLPADPTGFVGSSTREGDRAWVRVATPLGEQEAQLIRDDGRWRVLLKLD
jgi:hypothetical protein